ncbi:MAG: plasmid pRiA4b ORF-3 family protein [Bacillota bacterium]
MKAYIIKIELDESNPLIWRRVIMPADATFNRLNDIIQNVTNFKSGWPYDDYHLYEFDLQEEDILVTNDLEAYEEHKHYQNNKEMYKKRLENMDPEMAEFAKIHNQHLEKEVKKPKFYKIDDYLQKYKTINYTYDFGDNWEFTIKLEEVVYDYNFGFPTLLDGEQTAPPEDVGGIYGYYDFLEIYNDKNHSEYKETKEWAKGQNYKEYDKDSINKDLKKIKYKDTNWDKVDHKNYQIIDDKYRDKEI